MAALPAMEDTSKDCAWCKIMEQKVCKDNFDAFDACMEREGESGDEKCMPLFESFRACMAQKPSLVTMLRAALSGPAAGPAAGQGQGGGGAGPPSAAAGSGS